MAAPSTPIATTARPRILPRPLTSRQQTVLDAYSAAVRLLPPCLQPDLVLIGGAATLAHGYDRYAKDVDVNGTAYAIKTLWARVGEQGPGDFERAGRRKLTWTSPTTSIRVDFDVKVKKHGAQGRSRFPRSVSSELCAGYIATLPELLRNRGVTVVARDKWDEVRGYVDRDDLKLLLKIDGIVLPSDVSPKELRVFKAAVVKALGVSRGRAESIIKPLIV